MYHFPETAATEGTAASSPWQPCGGQAAASSDSAARVKQEEATPEQEMSFHSDSGFLVEPEVISKEETFPLNTKQEESTYEQNNIFPYNMKQEESTSEQSMFSYNVKQEGTTSDLETTLLSN